MKSIIFVAVLISIKSFLLVEGGSSSMLKPINCDRPIAEGAIIMGHPAVSAGTSSGITIKRNGTTLQNGADYIPGEALTIMSHVPGQFVLDVNQGTFFDTYVGHIGCSNKRYRDNLSSQLQLPVKGSGDVKVTLGYSSDYDSILVQTFTLSETGTTKSPTKAPSKSPVASQQSSSESSSSGGCFAGTESLTTESGATVTMNQVKVGDMVMVSSKDGRTSFSPVIVVPHPLNSEKTQFVQLTTESGRDIKMTPNHLIMSGTCGNVQSLKEASVVKMGECITTVTGIELVTDSKTVNGAGIYTVVTASDALLVVNGVVVSPFASNHMVANSFYNIHRFIYKLVPYMASHTVTAKIMKVFGDIMMSVTSV